MYHHLGIYTIQYLPIVVCHYIKVKVCDMFEVYNLLLSGIGSISKQLFILKHIFKLILLFLNICLLLMEDKTMAFFTEIQSVPFLRITG